MLRDDKNIYVFMYNDVWYVLGLLDVKTWGLGSDERLKNKSGRTKSREIWGFLGSNTGRSMCYGWPLQRSGFYTRGLPK